MYTLLRGINSVIIFGNVAYLFYNIYTDKLYEGLLIPMLVCIGVSGLLAALYGLLVNDEEENEPFAKRIIIIVSMVLLFVVSLFLIALEIRAFLSKPIVYIIWAILIVVSGLMVKLYEK